MDKRKNKAAHKVRELTSHLEEDDLWDLEDSWDDEDKPPPSEPEEEAAEAPEAEAHTEDTKAEKNVEEQAETPDLFENVSEESAEENVSADSDEDQPDEIEEVDEAKPTLVEVQEEEPTEPIAKDTFDDPELTPEEAAKKSAAELIKKAGLSTAEQIALAAVAIMFAGLAIWGYMFLHERNNLGSSEAGLDFPIEGKNVSVSGFKTFWQAARESSGVRLGAQVVPAATITLSDNSSGSGAFRLYFRNADKDSVGDPITITFENGKFSNGEKTLEVTASDGFHQEGDFNAYVLDRALAWRVQLLEADSATASGSDFEELLETIVEPVRR